MSIIIVASSPYHNFDQYIYNKDDILIGLEDGCYEIIKRNLPLDIAVSDFDTTKYLDIIKDKAIKFIKYPTKKDQIDLELALMYAKEYYPNECIHIFNALYGRMDHELITIKLLYKYPNIILHSDEEELFIVEGYYKIPNNTEFSIINFENVELEIQNAEYSLSKRMVDKNDCYTSCNRSFDNTFIKIYSGKVILVVKKEK